MSRRISLEDFDGPGVTMAPEAPPPPQIDLEGLRSAAFEEGYKSGWDDCRAEHLKSEDAVSSDLLQSLKDMGMSYDEARRDVLNALKPILDAIVTQLLPKLAADGLSVLVAAELMPMLQDGSDLEPELVCAPSVVPVLQKMIEKREELTIRIRPEPSFSGAQASLRLGAETREIDLGSAVEKIGQELESFSEQMIADLPEHQKGQSL